MLRTLGADLVGMSTVLEAIAARAAGLELLGLSTVTTQEIDGPPIDPRRGRRGRRGGRHQARHARIATILDRLAREAAAMRLGDRHVQRTIDPVTGSALAVEQNGINVIDESERKGSPQDLFWPWCAANISVFGISYGSLHPRLRASASGRRLVAGARRHRVLVLPGRPRLPGRAPAARRRRWSSRARRSACNGNRLPSFVSWILLVGWETVLVSLATLATATVFERLGWCVGNATKVVAFVVVAAIIVGAGVLGFDAIMRLQTVPHRRARRRHRRLHRADAREVDWSASCRRCRPARPAAFDRRTRVRDDRVRLGWVNAGADYSRYLPRSGVEPRRRRWTTFGASIAPIVLVLYGLLLAGVRSRSCRPRSRPTRSAR